MCENGRPLNAKKQIIPSNYRHQSYETSKRRKRKRNETKSIFRTRDRDHTKIYGTGSWFDQNKIESKLAGSSLTSSSASEENIGTGKIVSNLKSVKKKKVTQKMKFA